MIESNQLLYVDIITILVNDWSVYTNIFSQVKMHEHRDGHFPGSFLPIILLFRGRVITFPICATEKTK